MLTTVLQEINFLNRYLTFPHGCLQGVVTAGVVYWIHEQNFEERKQMRQGVIKVRQLGQGFQSKGSMFRAFSLVCCTCL